MTTLSIGMKMKTENIVFLKEKIHSQRQQSTQGGQNLIAYFSRLYPTLDRQTVMSMAAREQVSGSLEIPVVG